MTADSDRVTARLAEMNERTALRQQSEETIARLLDAVRRVLALADGAYVMLASHETGHAEPVAWDLDPAAVREAILSALPGESRPGLRETGEQ